MTPEARTKNAVKKELDKAGVYYFMPVTGGYGRSGIADIVGCINGFFLAIECKAPGKQPTPLQYRELQRVEDAGGVALVIAEVDDFRILGDVLQALKQKEKE